METYALSDLEKALKQRDIAVETLEKLKRSLQYDLKAWADENLDAGDDSYKELSEVMVSNGLDGLNRDYTVTVHVKYEFQVTVNAADEDEARESVESDIYNHLSDNLELSYYDDIDFDVDEA